MRGFTLIEIIVALAIFGLILTMVWTGFATFSTMQKLDRIGEETITLLRKAREKTVAGEGGFAYGIRVEEYRFILFRAPTYVEGNPTNEILALSSNFFVSAYSFQGGGSEIVFQKFTGGTGSFGTLTIQKRNDSTVQKIFRIYETGIVKIE